MHRRTVEITCIALVLGQYDQRTRLAAAAITLTEMYFRPSYWRLGEFFLALWLQLVQRDSKYLSVGVSQISLRHVCLRYSCNEKHALETLMDPRKCIENCCYLLAQENWSSIRELANFYNGNCSAAYLKLLEVNSDRVQQTAEYLLPPVHLLRQTHEGGLSPTKVPKRP